MWSSRFRMQSFARCTQAETIGGRDSLCGCNRSYTHWAMPSENGTIQIVIKHIPNVMFSVIIKQFCQRRDILIQQQLPQNILN